VSVVDVCESTAIDRQTFGKMRSRYTPYKVAYMARGMDFVITEMAVQKNNIIKIRCVLQPLTNLASKQLAKMMHFRLRYEK